MTIKNNNNGFTLIEVMITILVLVVGLSAMTVMQIQAMKGNQNAFSRSSANTIALSFLEEIKRLPFGDSNLTVGGGDLDAGKAPAGGSPSPSLSDHQYIPANFPALSSMFQVNGNQIVDDSGKVFDIFWNIIQTPISFGGTTNTPFCTLRLFMYWNTSTGTNSMIITTIKYNNTKAPSTSGKSGA